MNSVQVLFKQSSDRECDITTAAVKVEVIAIRLQNHMVIILEMQSVIFWSCIPIVA